MILFKVSEFLLGCYLFSIHFGRNRVKNNIQIKIWKEFSLLSAGDNYKDINVLPGIAAFVMSFGLLLPSLKTHGCPHT